MRAYRTLVAHPGVPRLVSAALVTRLSTSMLSLSLLLAVHDRTGSYGVAGLVLTGHAAALACLAPVNGRRADRRRAPSVLHGCLAVHVVGYAALLTALGLRAPTAVLVGSAVLVGASTPPSSAVIRGSWPRVVPPAQLPTAYALDSVTNEVTFVSGPLVVAAVVGLAAPGLVIGIAGSITVLGVLLLAATVPAVPVATACPRRAATLRVRVLGPLADPQVLLLLSMAATGAFTFGCMQIGAAASAAHFGSAGAVGVAASALSLGSVLGGLGFGARPWGGGRRWLLSGLYAGSALVVAVTAGATDLVLLVLLFGLAGLVTGPLECVEQLLLSDAGPPAYRTEVFAWLNTFMWTGYGVGTAVSGLLVRPTATGRPFLVAAAVLVAAGVAAIAVRPAAGAARELVEVTAAELSERYPDVAAGLVAENARLVD
jgi:MFS family permease